ncbi:alpha/beta hydrolase [Candidatus Pacearchaeota archaeon]|nr:alpha/beta hydrolase [Candidatus Pacearchaeota archaeon]
MNKKQVFAVILVILIGGYFYLNNLEKNPYEFKGNTFSYSEKRGRVDYNKILIEENKSFNLYKLDFNTRQLVDENLRIYGLLFVPKNNEEKIPSVIFLPGGQGTKESRKTIAETIAGFGYVVLVIDQRGVGETGGKFLDFGYDYKIFLSGEEPMQHLAVYDVLRSFDFLREQKNIDENKIAVIGESMGGRYGIIAAAIDRRIKGVIGISTSGFHVPVNPIMDGNNYIVSIDVDNYIKKITPRKLFMLHCKEDNVVPISDAEKTFSIANEPKKFKVFENCFHGYNPVMKVEMEKDLREIFES